MGQKLFEQFTTVVHLDKQICVQDPVWLNVLQHVCHGNCQKHQIDIIKSLIVTDPKCPHTDYDTSPKRMHG